MWEKSRTRRSLPRFASSKPSDTFAGIFRTFQQMRLKYKAQLQIVWHENKGIKPLGDKGA